MNPCPFKVFVVLQNALNFLPINASFLFLVELVFVTYNQNIVPTIIITTILKCIFNNKKKPLEIKLVFTKSGILFDCKMNLNSPLGMWISFFKSRAEKILSTGHIEGFCLGHICHFKSMRCDHTPPIHRP